MRIISQRVAPRASAASLSCAGTVAMTSREIDETIGRIMIAMISPAMKQFGIETGPPTSGRNENVSENHCSAGCSFGASTKIPQSP